MSFTEGALYTRKQISDEFGGIGVGILPKKGDQIVCGLFDLADAVTHLSGEIDVYAKKLPKAAKGLEEKIPVFIKVSSQLWRYTGEYKLAEIETAKRVLDKAKKELGREEIGAILRFQPVKPPLRLVTHQ